MLNRDIFDTLSAFWQNKYSIFILNHNIYLYIDLRTDLRLIEFAINYA